MARRARDTLPSPFATLSVEVRATRVLGGGVSSSDAVPVLPDPMPALPSAKRKGEAERDCSVSRRFKALEVSRDLSTALDSGAAMRYATRSASQWAAQQHERHCRPTQELLFELEEDLGKSEPPDADLTSAEDDDDASPDTPTGPRTQQLAAAARRGAAAIPEARGAGREHKLPSWIRPDPNSPLLGQRNGFA